MNDELANILLAIVKANMGDLFIGKDYLEHGPYEAVKVEVTEDGLLLKLTSLEVIEGTVLPYSNA